MCTSPKNTKKNYADNPLSLLYTTGSSTGDATNEYSGCYFEQNGCNTVRVTIHVGLYGVVSINLKIVYILYYRY